MANEYSNLFMNLPDVKNYADGCVSGEAAGQAYLKYVKTNAESCSSLQIKMLRVMESYSSLDKEEKDGLRGHIVGMCSFINDLIQHRCFAGDLIEKINSDKLANTVSKAENGFFTDQWKEMARLEKSERKAANKRWEKHRKPNKAAFLRKMA
jgi:uncharacterized protein (DUF305 family)